MLAKCIRHSKSKAALYSCMWQMIQLLYPQICLHDRPKAFSCKLMHFLLSHQIASLHLSREICDKNSALQIDRLKDLLEESASWQAPTISQQANKARQEDSTAAAGDKTVQPGHSHTVDAAAIEALGKMEKQASLIAQRALFACQRFVQR